METLVKDFEKYAKKGRGFEENKQIVYKFPNGYGASVVHGEYTYGLELAVIKFTGNDFVLDYSTEITDDVRGYLDQESLERTLQGIFDLRGA